jgi:sulfate permease, SulP family
VVSATTATSAVSAAAVAPLAGGDVARFAVLSAALALVTAVILVAAGLFRLGGLADFVPKAVMTGFLFALGLIITVGQLPSLLGVEPGDGEFFGQAWSILTDLDDAHGTTVAIGLGSVALMLALQRLAPAVPGTLVVLVVGIVVSALFGLADHGVAVIGHVPTALPDPGWPSVSADDLAKLVPSAFGIMLLTTEAVGVARALASHDGYQVDSNRDLIALGGSNALAGLSSGFVQSGGASQTAAAQKAGGKTQLASVVAALLVLLTGAFLAPLFQDLPQATLAAIVIVAVSGFYDVGELRRYARVWRAALIAALIALFSALLLGVLPGLLFATVLTFALLIRFFARPSVRVAAASGGVVDARADGPIFYANAVAVTDEILSLVLAEDPLPERVVLHLEPNFELDIQALDSITTLRRSLEHEGIQLELVGAHRKVQTVLRAAGVPERVIRSG